MKDDIPLFHEPQLDPCRNGHDIKPTGTEHVFTCKRCEELFYTGKSVTEIIGVYERANSQLGHQMTDIIWNLHEKAVAKYGEKSDIASAILPVPVADCEAQGHDWAGGICRRCGRSGFLGG